MRVVGDVVLGVSFAALLVFWAVRVATSWGGRYWLFGFAAGAVVCLLALVRGRDRVRAAGAGLAVAGVAVLVAWFAEVPGEPGPAMALGLSVLVGSAVRASPPVPACAVAVAGLAVVAGAVLTGRLPGVVLLNGVAWLAGCGTGLGLRLRDAARLAVVERVRRAERLELARELHDVVAHHISGIVLQTQAARIARRTRPETLDESLAGVEAAGSEALAAMRRVVGLLRDADDAAPAAGPEELGRLVERFAGHGPPVRLRLPDGARDWRPEVTSTVHRVVQESLTNVARHAPHAHSVTVDVAEDARSVVVSVTDDAAPGHQARRGGYGLVGLRERVEALDGTLTAGPRPGGGWSVLATLPVEER